MSATGQFLLSLDIIFITSGGMYTQALHLDDLEYTQGKYSGATAYARSKRAQVVSVAMKKSPLVAR